ncbi:HCN4 [Symbiodinium microadriaticum]|nr:HCN4 [Symbiodinium microadriaticum]
MARRLALILANGAYTQRPRLSRPAAAAAELSRKLNTLGFEVHSATDQTLIGMKAAVEGYLRLVAKAAESSSDSRQEPLLLFCTFCGHGSAGRFLPVDCSAAPLPEDTFCFFEDLLFKLFETLRSDDFIPSQSWRGHHAHTRENLLHRLDFGDDTLRAGWRCCGIRILMVIESCRRLVGDELTAYHSARARAAYGKRHLLPCMQAMRPELATVGGADWDAARMAWVARQLGREAPQLLLALSSESTTPSYDVVFLRSIIDSIDKPVRLGGILERAALDTLRRTGHQQRPVWRCQRGGPSRKRPGL